MNASSKSSFFTSGAADSQPFGPPLIGALLRVPWEAVQRHMLSGMLSPLGFELCEAASGEESLALIRDRHVDAVLMDVEMPGMNGWEACRRLREHGYENLPVIMVSANLFAKVDELTYWSGCQGFIDKPVIEAELLAMLGRMLSLQWTYRPLPEMPARRAQRDDVMHIPPSPELRTLRNLARIGHVMAIRRKLQEMERIDPRYTAFAARLHEPLKQFNLERFITLLGETGHVPH